MSKEYFDQLDLGTALLMLSSDNLNLFDQAELMYRLCTRYHLTQHELAKHLSISQSSVGNKIRLLQYTDQERHLILEHNLTERHARTLLRISPPKRTKLIETVGNVHLTVQQTEELIEKYQTNADNREYNPSMDVMSVDKFVASIQTGAATLQRRGSKVSCLTETSDKWIKISLTVFRS